MVLCSNARELFPPHQRGREEEAAARTWKERLCGEGDCVEGAPSQEL